MQQHHSRTDHLTYELRNDLDEIVNVMTEIKTNTTGKYFRS